MSWQQIRNQAIGCATALVAATVANFGAAVAAGSAYTVANYPVDATSANAVAAKERAYADGRQAAFRSLLKRIVPVTAYKQIANVKGEDAGRLIEGIAVRSERTSATQYIASLDFSFQAEAVRDLLARQGIPLVDVQSPAIVVVPVYSAPAGAEAAIPVELTQSRAGRAWAEGWKGLDLEHALTPIKLATLKPDISPQALQSLRNGDGGALSTIARSYAADYLVIAFAEGDGAGKRLNVTLVGQDAVGGFQLKRSYRLAADDFSYTAELAAVVALGTLEGRWKARQTVSLAGGNGALGGAPKLVQLMVEFRNLQQWQGIRRQIAELPGVRDVEVGGISARNADVELRYPGGGDSLADALQAQGLEVRRAGDALVVRPSP